MERTQRIEPKGHLVSRSSPVFSKSSWDFKRKVRPFSWSSYSYRATTRPTLACGFGCITLLLEGSFTTAQCLAKRRLKWSGVRSRACPCQKKLSRKKAGGSPSGNSPKLYVAWKCLTRHNTLLPTLLGRSGILISSISGRSLITGQEIMSDE